MTGSDLKSLENSILVKENSIWAKISKGYGVASGNANDHRFPGGTISMQIPFFYSKGLDLSAFYHGTLNADLGSHSFQLMKPNYRFKDIKWSKDLPSETFSFYACEIKLSSERQTYKSWIYWPHPSTKPEFKQKENILEILAPFIGSISYGSKILLSAKKEQILFQKPD